MRKKILIVHLWDRASSVVCEALDKSDSELVFLSGLSDVLASILELKPTLVLFEIICWQKPLEKLLSEVMNLKIGRTARKIILADSAELDDKVRALDLGADDFLLKPISSRELLVRINAVLRSHMPAYPEDKVQTLGELSLYREAMEISVGRERKKLSPKEFDLFCCLMDHPGRVFSREELLESVWIPWEIEDRRVVDVYIWRLREKIEVDPSNPRWLITRRGKGYSLVSQ
ncbi:MAG: winged helix-turn-helix domain-containing protein [Edaphobacter sp.]